jgi:alkylated DNA repair dioxygenase AlkB
MTTAIKGRKVRKTDLLEETSTAVVSLYENVLDPVEADNLLHQLSQELPFKIETDDFGLQSRSTCYVGDSQHCIFAYVGLTLIPLPWTPTLQRLRDYVAHACGLKDQVDLTACLVNYYPQNEGYIPWHYDEVRAHEETKTVASMSLGGPRRFCLRKRAGDQSIVADLMLPSGSVLLMQGTTQEDYEHSLPLDEHHAPPRISLTFRSIVPGWESNQQLPKDACCTESPTYSKK